MKMLMLASAVPLILSMGSLPVHAEEINLETTGSSFSIGAGGTITTVVSKRVSKGKKGLEGSTATVNSFTVSGGTCQLSNGGTGSLLTYVISNVVSIQDDGDMVTATLDDTQTQPNSTICQNEETGQADVLVYRRITGGTGVYENACGYVDFIGTGTRLGGNLTAIQGAQTGEIFLDPLDGAGTRGCPP